VTWVWAVSAPELALIVEVAELELLMTLWFDVAVTNPPLLMLATDGLEEFQETDEPVSVLVLPSS
jgi:hypothetical protein